MPSRLYVLRAVISPSLASNHHQTRHIGLPSGSWSMPVDVVGVQDATAPSLPYIINPCRAYG